MVTGNNGEEETVLLFDLKVKESREDLFGRDKLLDQVERCLQIMPITVLMGPRRMGKTSLLKTALNELNYPYVYVDVSALEESGYTKFNLYRLMEKAFTHTLSRWGTLKGFMKTIRGVTVSAGGVGVKVELDWTKEGPEILDLFRAFNDWAEKEGHKYVVIALDEVQLLRKMRRGERKLDLKPTIKQSADLHKHIRFILTGSEVGLLVEYLDVYDTKGPLYGRGRIDLPVDRFDRATSIAFLKAGFEQSGMEVSQETLEAAVDKLDGTPGWLALFGSRALSLGRADKDVLERVFDEAKGLVVEEVSKLFRRSKYYAPAAKAVLDGNTRWTGIKTSVISALQGPVGDEQVSRALETLAAFSVIEKEGDQYAISDPLMREAVRALTQRAVTG